MPILTKPIEEQYWTPDLRFAGQTVFVLGSGPSLTTADVELLRGRRVIVVNGSYQLCPWGEILFFMDNGWFLEHEEIVVNWPGEVITYSRRAKGKLKDRAKRIWTEGIARDSFPPPGSHVVRHGNNSGQTALSLAIALGAKTVVLLGFDMKPTKDGRTHCHSEYGVADDKQRTVYQRIFLPFFKGWDAGARAIGVDVFNATPDSALEEFRKVDLREFLLELGSEHDENKVGERVLAAGGLVAG